MSASLKMMGQDALGARSARERVDLPLLFATAALVVRMNLRRLTTWAFAAVFLTIAWLLYRGPLQFGGMTASGAKLATNADFAIAALCAAFSLFLMHFTATLTGDVVAQDVRLRTAPLLQATPIGARTYLLGKFTGGYASVLLLYAIFIAALVIGQWVPPASDKLTLAPRLWPYAKHALLFVVVPTFFVGALSFAIGTLTGNMKTVYVVVTALLVAWFLVISVLGDEGLRWIVAFEPSGQAWLVERVAKNRGNSWLNEHVIRPDRSLLANRVVLVAAGLAALVVTLRRWRPGQRDVEYSGDVQRPRLHRAADFVLGRQAAVPDLYANWIGRDSVPRAQPAARGVRLWLAQMGASLRVELRLLLAERSLWIMIPMIMLLAGVDSVSHAGPFHVRIYPVSSEYAQQMVPTLLLLLAGTTIFYTGEVFHRDDENGVRGILHACPVSNGTLVLSKFAALLLVSLFMVELTVLTGVASQAVQWARIDGRAYLDLAPYAAVVHHVVHPAVFLMCAAAAAIHVLVRNRYAATFACITLAGATVFFLLRWRSLLVNPLMVGHWGYSDLTGVQPFLERFRWRSAYWGSIAIAALGLACWWMQRSRAPWSARWRPRTLRMHPLAIGAVALGIAAAVASGRVIHRLGNLRGTRWERERAALALEDAHAAALGRARLSWTSLDVDVELEPRQRRLSVRGRAECSNPYTTPLEEACFTVDPSFQIQRFELSGASGEPRREGPLLFVPLARPLARGERAVLDYAWSGQVGAGWDEEGHAPSTFLHEGAVFLSSFEPQLAPLPGVSLDVFLSDRRRRTAHQREAFQPLPSAESLRSSPDYVAAEFGSDLPFALDLRARVAGSLTVVCCGDLIEESARDGWREFHYRSRVPLRSFALLAGRYERSERGGDSIWHLPQHAYNVDTIGAALVDGRRIFTQRFGAYAYGSLSIVEFPRLASFAQSYPGLVPFSESIGFLTDHANDPRHVDATYFVTAHELAHQWWGYITNPALAAGAPVLSESLAEYSAMLLIDETRGERERLVFLRQEEDAYLRRRNADTEVALSDLQLEGQPLWYHKGGLVFAMLERQIGRDALTHGLARYVARWRDDEPLGSSAARAAGPGGGAAATRGHPTILDLLDDLRAAHHGVYLEWFYDAWFKSVILPDLVFVGSPRLVQESSSYAVEFEATNVGSGRVPVRVEALRGPWRPTHKDAFAPGRFETSEGALVWLEPGKVVRGVVSCAFRPEYVVIDRLHETIDFDRTNNEFALGDPESSDAAPR